MPKTLLLADDSVTIQKVVGISFANEDVVLLTVDNGDDAIARAREARPDLVLADVMMPGRDGYEVCEAIKSDPELRHVPVLLLSGTFEPFDEERARRAGADGHITKPFEAQALVDQVNDLLARSATAREAASPGPPADATLAVNSAEVGEPEAAFDFFDEEMAQTAPSPPGAPTVVVADDELSADALELESAVEDDEALAREPAAPDAFDLDEVGLDTQATVAILDDEEVAAPRRSTPIPFFGEDFDESSLAAKTDVVGAGSRETRDAPAGYEESFDFGFEESEAIAARPAAPSPFAETALTADPPAETELFDEGLGEPFEAKAGTVPPAGAIPMAPAPVRDLRAPPPLPTRASAEAAAPRDLSEAIRGEMQRTLEKIAWEAFGDLSERIVREALERVEAVAWEVIPQMAEVLIREEIRRLKSDPE